MSNVSEEFAGQYVAYTYFRVLPAWRRLPVEDRAAVLVHQQVEDDVEGCDLKRDQVLIRLNQKALGDLSVEFFNSKSDPAEGLRDRLMARVAAVREAYASELGKLEGAVERLAVSRGIDLGRASLEALDELWEEVKGGRRR